MTLQICPAPGRYRDEFLHFIESNRSMGLGLGYVDVHLLTSAKPSGLPLWTLDRTLQTAAPRHSWLHPPDH